MKFSTPKLLLLAIASTFVISCSVSEDDQLTNNKLVTPEIEQMSSKDADSTSVNEPLIPKPRG